MQQEDLWFRLREVIKTTALSILLQAPDYTIDVTSEAGWKLQYRLGNVCSKLLEFKLDTPQLRARCAAKVDNAFQELFVSGSIEFVSTNSIRLVLGRTSAN